MDLAPGSLALLATAVVLAMTPSFVRMSSCSALEAADGEDALRKFADHRDAVPVLLTDAILPKKKGRDIADEIRRQTPSVKVLFMSGYTADIIRAKSMLDADVFLLSKPIIPDQLLVKLRQVLNA